MLFIDKLNIKTQELQPEFEKLFRDILNNQTHEGDLLLVRINGFYHPEAHNWDNVENKSPYMIGLNDEGHSDLLHYKFIDDYRKKSISNLNYDEYLAKHIWSDENAKAIKDLTEEEGMSIQLEMLVYLKIWEADLFIKKLYQLVNLSLGEPYDWHFKIKESNRNQEPTTGKREEIIRKKIRDKIKSIYPKLYSAIENAYKTQVRNSIAHSTYYFAGRYIHLGNYIKDDMHSQLQVLSFNDWIDMFHDTIVIYNQLIGFTNGIDALYSKVAYDNNLLFQVRLHKQDPIDAVEYYMLKYRPEFNDWGFASTKMEIKV